jgi:hypothetical protein
MLIKFLTKRELTSYKNLINTKLKKNHIYTKNSNFFDWLYKYDDNFYNVAIALSPSSNVIGFQNFIPISQFDKSANEQHIFLALWFVDDMAKPGTGLRLFKFIETSFKNYSISTSGFDPKMKNFHKWQKFKIGILNHYYMINPNIKQYKICKTNHKEKKINLNENSLKKINYIKINLKNINKINPQIFDLSSPKKSISYLINRYLKHPIYKYNIIYRSHKKNYSIIVYRKNFFNKRTCVRVVDYIGQNQNIILFEDFFKSLLNNSKCEYIDIYNTGLDKKSLIKTGFNLKKDDEIIIPDFFDPFQKKNIQLLYGNKCKKKNFLLFKADGDRDRPNRNYL